MKLKVFYKEVTNHQYHAVIYLAVVLKHLNINHHIHSVDTYDVDDPRGHYRTMKMVIRDV